MLGVTITNHWLYYLRPIAFLILEIRLLVCIAHQSDALAGLGYDIAPAPVRVSARPFLLGVFALTLAAIPPALWLGGRIPTGPAEPAAQLTAEQEDIRARLGSLGLPEDVAAALDGAELERCAQAEAVRAGRTYDTDHTDNETPRTDGPAVLHELGGGEAELSSWLLFLPEDQVRQIHFFRYRAMPDLHLQEQFSVDPSGNFHAEDYAGRLTEDQQLWYELELHRLGHLHYSPSFSFSIPRGAEGMRGWIAYTTAAVPSPLVENPSDWSYGDFWYVFLRHQERWLHYPFVSIRDLGGSRSAGAYGPIRSVYAPFTFYPGGRGTSRRDFSAPLWKIRRVFDTMEQTQRERGSVYAYHPGRRHHRDGGQAVHPGQHPSARGHRGRPGRRPAERALAPGQGDPGPAVEQPGTGGGKKPARLPGHGHGLCVRGAGPGDPHRGRVRGGHP